MRIEKRSSDSDHLNWLNKYSENFWAGKKIADLGCGSGYLCQSAIDSGAAYACGLDIELPHGLPASEILTFEKDNLDSPQWHTSLTRKCPGGYFDIVLALDIIEHLNSPYLFLRNCNKVLRVGGLLVLTTPNINSWERMLKPQNWSGSIDPQHKTLFNIYSLKFLLSRTNFTADHIEAPVRSLRFLNSLTPPIGGQIFSVFRKEQQDIKEY